MRVLVPVLAIGLAAVGFGVAEWLRSDGGSAGPEDYSAYGVAPGPDMDPIEITWRDLAPQPQNEDEQDAIDRMNAALYEFMGAGPQSVGAAAGPGPGIIAHGGAGGFVLDGETLTADYDEKRVRMLGYSLPLDWAEDGVRQFLLVPFIGACLHVPPPPANQIILIDTEKPYMPSVVFEAVAVTGVFSRFKTDTEGIVSGYRIAATDVSPYEAR